MHEPTLLAIAVAVFAYAALARRLADTALTAPLLALGLGLALYSFGLAPGALDLPLDVIAEIALAIVLFSDAARTDARALIRTHRWPLRMLGLGLPLAVGLGFLAGLLLLPGWPLLEVALLAAILAPTDAALGQAVASSPRLPPRLRRALVVESGLNDGLALPLVLLFASLAAAAEAQSWAGFLGFIAAQIGFGALAGAVSGGAGGWLLGQARARDWPQEETEGIAALALVACAYLLAETLGGNAFVACFIGGLTFGGALARTGPGRIPGRAASRKARRLARAQSGAPPRGFLDEFLEGEGQILVLAAFLLIGASLLPDALARIRGAELALVLVSLFAIRPAAIWLSLAGSDAPPLTRLFLGWFGPRGLATALFALIATRGERLMMGDQILAVAAIAVAISALLHGATAAPAARRLGPKLRDPVPEGEGEADTRSRPPSAS